MSPRDWNEQAEEILSERIAAKAANLEPLAIAAVLVFKTCENEIITRVIARGDFAPLNSSFAQIGQVAEAAIKQHTLN